MNRDCRKIYIFYFIVFLMSSILWIIGYLFKKMILPGLPLSSIMAIFPAITAIIVGTSYTSKSYISTIICQIGDISNIKKIWLLPGGLLNPLIFYLSYLTLLMTKGPSLGTTPVSGELILAFGLFIFAAYAEELGWTGFVFPILERQTGWIVASAIQGILHSFWHYIPFLQAGRNLSWILWQTLFLTTNRIILIWLFRQSGRKIIIAALFHSTINISWQLFPINGSCYDPFISGTISAFFAIILVIAESSNFRELLNGNK